MFISNKLFGGVIDHGRLALNLRMEKQGLIQSNVANIETPGYNVQDFDFANALESALLEQGRLAKTNVMHITPDPVEASASMAFSSEDRPVDLDEEMLKLSENELMYQIVTKVVGKKLEGLKNAIDEGGK